VHVLNNIIIHNIDLQGKWVTRTSCWNWVGLELFSRDLKYQTVSIL